MNSVWRFYSSLVSRWQAAIDATNLCQPINDINDNYSTMFFMCNIFPCGFLCVPQLLTCDSPVQVFLCFSSPMFMNGWTPVQKSRWVNCLTYECLKNNALGLLMGDWRNLNIERKFFLTFLVHSLVMTGITVECDSSSISTAVSMICNYSMLLKERDWPSGMVENSVVACTACKWERSLASYSGSAGKTIYSWQEYSSHISIGEPPNAHNFFYFYRRSSYYYIHGKKYRL